jgi:hypothetical protein
MSIFVSTSLETTKSVSWGFGNYTPSLSEMTVSLGEGGSATEGASISSSVNDSNTHTLSRTSTSTSTSTSTKSFVIVAIVKPSTPSTNIVVIVVPIVGVSAIIAGVIIYNLVFAVKSSSGPVFRSAPFR